MVDHPREPKAPRARRQARSAAHPEAGATDASTKDVDRATEPASCGERVAKALARAGVASRREVERLIGEGRVTLNGEVLTTPAVKITENDILLVDGAQVAAREPTRLWRYHKPVGLVTTHRDPMGRPTVFDTLPEGLPRVISIGRLDLNSEGLLLLTNDGAVSRALELPANGWVRRYRARAYGRVSQAVLDDLAEGLTIDGVAYGPITARLDKVAHKAGDTRESPANVWISLALNEGRNREVRRVLESLGLKVNRLVRLAYGPFALGPLASGAIEEVGPRVIREQLADHVTPASMPSGDRVSATTAVVRATSTAAKALGDPDDDATLSTKVAARRAQSPQGSRPVRPPPAIVDGRPEKPVYKAGWAKPKPSKRVHPPRRPGGKAEAGATLPRPPRSGTRLDPGGATTSAKSRRNPRPKNPKRDRSPTTSSRSKIDHPER